MLRHKRSKACENGRMRNPIVLIASLVLLGACIPAIALASNGDMLVSLTSTNVTASAQGTFTANENARWALGTNGGLAISGSGAIEADEAVYDIAEQVKTIYIGKDISSIGTETFSFFNNLEAVEFEEGSCLESIGDYAFANCECLTTISLPTSTRLIGTSAFQDCSSLSLLSLGGEEATLESIGASAFSNCTSLCEVSLPQTLKEIERNAFDGCESLTAITIPASVERVAEGAFENCGKLKDVTVQDPSKTSIDDRAFSGHTAKKPPSISVKKIKVGKRCASVTWNKVKSAGSYKVFYKKKGGSKYKAKAVRAGKTRIKLKKLARGKRYRVYVIAKADGATLCKSAVKTSKRIK